MATRHRFQARLMSSGKGGGHLVHVPEDVVTALGGRGRMPVRATFNGIAYRGSIVTTGPSFVLGVTKAIMAETGVGLGDTLDVAIELDTEERAVEVPPDLAKALARNKTAQAAWASLSFTNRKEYVQAIEEAKRPETRARRVERTIGQLAPEGSGA